ncbi:cytoskeleton-associated protein 2-like isoform X4 [Passer montanus]|uniref:cytoskeleton-associated protein 2-like isoform X4 n=1 Tax=Passer montanus TaxID=9160 RepID=UPI001960894C|nr:cytoskeleton-associated protein 2-like isoform X4 [Passer montanus]
MSTHSLSTETCVHCISCHLFAAQRRSQLQNCQAAKERLKCTSAKPFLKDWTNHLNTPLEPVSKLKSVNSNKKDVLGTVMEGAQEDGKLGAKSMQDTGHTALKKASNTCQRAGGVQPGNDVTFPASAQARGRLPPSSSGHLNPERSQKPAQETVTAAAPQVGNDHSLHSLNVGLQDRLVCNKENLGPQASTSSELIRTIHSNKNSVRKEVRVSAHRQERSGTSRSALGQKGSMGNHQAKEETDLDKFRKTLPESRRSQNTSNTAQPLQPSRLLPASTGMTHKNPGTKQGEVTTVRQPGTAPGGSLKHSQSPPVRFSTLGKSQGTTNLKSNLNSRVTLPWPRPMVKEKMERKDMKVVAPGHTAASRGTGHQHQSHSIHNSKTRVPEDDLRSRRDQPEAELLKAGGMQAGRVPRTPSAADRRKQLEEWLAAKGKTYKRPPMMLLQKQAVKPSCRKVKATEEQENPEQRYQAKINNIFTECLKLIEEPVEELRQTALKILKDAGQQLEGEKAEEPIPWEPTTPCPAERQPMASTPGLVGRPMTSLPPSVKLQVTSASRGKEFLEGPELKFVTPVRRSLRTERAQSRYPEMLKDHDPVVSSLSEILDAEEDTRFFFRKNKALPEVAELEGLSSYSPTSC